MTTDYFVPKFIISRATVIVGMLLAHRNNYRAKFSVMSLTNIDDPSSCVCKSSKPDLFNDSAVGKHFLDNCMLSTLYFRQVN